MFHIIVTDKTLESKRQKDVKIENEHENVNKNENDNVNENENENGKTLMSSDKDHVGMIKILMYSDEYAETTDQNEKNIAIKKLIDHFDKMIDKSKSYLDQIESLAKVENLDEYYFINDFDEKELKSKIFKLNVSRLLKLIDKKLFEQILVHTLETLGNKLISTTNKKENQINVKNINENRDKIYEMDQQ